MEKYKLAERPARLVRGMLIAATGALSLTACAEDPEVLPNQPAVITEHLYDDADDYLVLVGKVPIWQHDEEHFYLRVEQCERVGQRGADERGCVTADVEVSAETYHAYPNGSQISFAPKK